MAEAIKRGRAYAEAGADALVFPGSSADMTAELIKSLPKPVCVLGPVVPGAAFTLHTGWGWMGAAQLHWERARKLMETGSVEMSAVIEDKAQLIEQDVYDLLIEDWTKKTGRSTRSV